MKKVDGRKNNGAKKGESRGQGRKSKADEDKAKLLLKKALKSLYSTNDDEEATVEFLKEFIPTPRGQQFTAEHLLGKPKEQVESSISIESIKPIEWVK